MQGEGGPVRVFYSYSHADEALLNKLRLHLAPLRRRGLIVEWSDRAIDAGTDWAEEIKRNLASADLVLLLISKHFIASEFCYGTEMTAALERDARGEARVVPVILSPCRWLKLPFARLQAVPRDNQAVTASCWVNEDEAFDEVAGRIEVVVEALRAAPAAPHPTLSRERERETRGKPLAHSQERKGPATGEVRAAGAAPKPPPGPQLTLPEPKNGVYIGVDPLTLPDRAVFKDVDAPWCPEMVVIPAGTNS